jgi:hypothetical protein
MEEQEKSLQEQITQALGDETLPVIYFNGFANTAGSGDVVIVLMRHNKPVAILNLSHSVAKSLAARLSDVISTLEQRTGNIIMSADDMYQKLTESGSK